MAEGSFATAINCMDGRVQHPVAELLKKKYKVDHVDTITEPGPDGILAANQDKAAIESIKRRVDVSTGKHGSKHIAIVGHHDCAGNPVDKGTHLAHIRAAIKTVKSWGVKAEVIGLWVDDGWKVSEVK
jgi:carbonic anhydrase